MASPSLSVPPTTATAAYHLDHDGNLWKTEWFVSVNRDGRLVPVAGPFGRLADARAAEQQCKAQDARARVYRYETEPGAFEVPA